MNKMNAPKLKEAIILRNAIFLLKKLLQKEIEWLKWNIFIYAVRTEE